MPMLNKLLGVATLGSTWGSVVVLSRFVSGAARLVALTIITAFLCCLLLLAGFAVVYYGLVSYGLEPYVAAVAVALMIFLTTVILGILTLTHIQKLRDLMRRRLSPSASLPSRVEGLANAFLDGLTRKSSRS